uniref:Uncharacterized protein n=1 Tax=viral metagenome TaxID=1070528 RepID=A0A6C0DN46_9ZZZZ
MMNINYKKYINDVDNIKALNEYWNTNKLILIDYYKN